MISRKNQRLISSKSEVVKSFYSYKETQTSQIKLSWVELEIKKDESKIYIKQFKSSPIDIRLSVVTGAKLDLGGDTA
jgi:hypothetical protein